MTMLADLAAAAVKVKDNQEAVDRVTATADADRAAVDADFHWAMEYTNAGNVMPEWTGHPAGGDWVTPFATAEIAPEIWLACVTRRRTGTVLLTGQITLNRRCPGCHSWREDPIRALTDFATLGTTHCDGAPHIYRRLPQHDAAEGSVAR